MSDVLDRAIADRSGGSVAVELTGEPDALTDVAAELRRYAEPIPANARPAVIETSRSVGLVLKSDTRWGLRKRPADADRLRSIVGVSDIKSKRMRKGRRWDVHRHTGPALVLVALSKDLEAAVRQVASPVAKSFLCDPIVGVIHGFEFKLMPADVAAFLPAAHRGDFDAYLAEDRPDGLVRAAVARGSRVFGLGIAGPGVHGRQHFDELVAAARELAADAAYVSIIVEEDLSQVIGGFGWGRLEWRAVGTNAAGAYHTFTDLVPDVFPYQVLNRRHVEGAPGLPDVVERLGPDRSGLRLGEFVDWLDSGRRHAIQRRGWELVAPLLLAKDRKQDVEQRTTLN